MTIRLRPHHLLCLLTYSGRGYGPAFTVNYDAIAGRISQGEQVLIIEGPDDICAPLLGDSDPHCRRDTVEEGDRLAARDVGQLLTCSIHAGATMALAPELLLRMRHAFSSGRTRRACNGCEWSSLCSSIAAEGYRGALVSGEG